MGFLGWETWGGGLGVGSWDRGLEAGIPGRGSVGAGVLGLESWDGGLGVRVGWLVSQCQGLANHGLREPNRIDSNFRENSSSRINSESKRPTTTTTTTKTIMPLTIAITITMAAKKMRVIGSVEAGFCL